MRSILVSWIGEHDLRSVEKGRLTGPVAALLNSEFSKSFDEVYLLFSYPEDRCKKFFRMLSDRFTFHSIEVGLNDPMNYRDIYLKTKDILNGIESDFGDVKWNFHTSPGTPAMSAIWILLGKTNYPANLFTSWIDKNEEKVKKLEIPFDINIDFIPEFKKKEGEKISSGWNSIPSFLNIIHRSEKMRKLLDNAYKMGIYDVPVLILGETGTGKEMLAKAIHDVSLRKKKKFNVVNCGAIPENLIETTLFGWSKGAYTGADKEGEGLFRESEGGTLFLDEIGELPLKLQVKLLRVLQEKEIQRVGDNKTFKVNVRVIAATNKNLGKMVSKGLFREDLFHRLAIGILKLPPLRERGKDVILIARYFLKEINDEFGEIGVRADYKKKMFSPSALKFLTSYGWPGNARELYNTVKRACIWKEDKIIEKNDLKNSIVDYSDKKEISVAIPAEGIDLKGYLQELEKNFAKEAIKIGGSKAKAAKLLKINPKTFEKRCREIFKI